MEREAEVVVIGGGIVGCAAAYYLAKRNVPVVLLEKHEIGWAQSSRAWGFVRQQGRDPAELPLMVEGNRLWQGLSAELHADIEWVQGGNLALANDETRLAQMEGWLATARAWDLDTRLLSREEVKRLIPSMEGPWLGGMWTPGDGHAEPTKATAAFARAAARQGARVITHCGAERIEVAGGRVLGVQTSKGLVRAPAVVCAAGAWSSRLAGQVGLNLPQLAVRSTAAETTPAPPVTAAGVWAGTVAFRQRLNGSFYIAGGARSDYDLRLDVLRHMRAFLPNYLKNRRLFQFRLGRDFWRDVIHSAPGMVGKRTFARIEDREPRANPRSVNASLAALKELFPSLAGLQIKRSWAGMIDSTPDAVPVLGEVSELPGFLFATGFSGHGFAMGPIAGRLLAEIVTTGRSSIDIEPLRFSRFAEGRLALPKNVL